MLSAALTASLSAQNENEAVYELDPVVVTGDLWESELQKTTASVSVLDQATLDNNGVQHFEDVVNSIPNLTWTGATSRPRYIQIRGIGENSQFEGETPDSSVRFLIDDFDLTGLGTVGNLFDVQQVEVLRGPQAGAFGANAAGGVVKVVSKEPTSYWTGQAEATIGNDNLYEMGVAVGGPILEDDPEQLTFRFSINSLNRDGFRENQFLDKDDTNERDELTSRLKVRWLPNELWSFEGGLLYADADNGYDEFTLTNERTDTFSDQPGRDEQETRGASLRGSYHGFDNVLLTYIGQITDTDSLYSYDSDWSNPVDNNPNLPGNYAAFLATDREREVFSHELRFDSKEQENALGWIDRWTLGLYFHSLDEESEIAYDENYEGWTEDAFILSDYESESFAIFTQLAHDFSESTRVTLGLRVERHDVSFASDPVNNYYGSLGSEAFDQDETLFGGKLTFEHELNKEHTAFASVARGYKAGGANSGAFRLAFDPGTYDDETLYNFELGLRSEWLDGRLTSSLTAFYLYRNDAQLRDSRGAGGFFRYLTVNGENAAHYGLESELTWRIDEALTAYASLGLLETDRDAYNTIAADQNDDPIMVRVPARKLSNAPNYTYRLGVAYDRGSGFFGNTEVVGKDDYYESNSHDEKRDSFALVNASLGYRWDNWTVTLWAKNLFDEEYTKRVFYFNNLDGGVKRYESLTDPRTFGVTANYRW